MKLLFHTQRTIITAAQADHRVFFKTIKHFTVFTTICTGNFLSKTQPDLYVEVLTILRREKTFLLYGLPPPPINIKKIMSREKQIAQLHSLRITKLNVLNYKL